MQYEVIGLVVVVSQEILECYILVCYSVLSLSYPDKHIPLKPVLTRAPIQSLNDLNPGDHLLLGSQHCLAQSIKPEANTFSYRVQL